jgi:transcriptional regulator with XRE-family HTH domain
MSKEREGQQHDQGPPGRPLWERAEAARIAGGWSKGQWAERIGIGRVTYDRLREQDNKPLARTVNKIADAIGISHTAAGVLGGLIEQPSSAMETALRDATADHTSSVRGDVAQHLQALRQASREQGKTLGDVLVLAGLAEADELKMTPQPAGPDSVTRTEQDPDIPDEIKQTLLDGYRRLVAEVADSVRKNSQRGD